MGTVVLSVDAELGWGFHDFDAPHTGRLGTARKGWRTLLDLCDEFRIPATWAIVGHLMLEDCDGTHASHPAPDGWFAHERGPNALARDLRFGEGLVEAVSDAVVDHEIGSHTFSHVEFGAPWTTRELARAEVAASIEAARERGFDVTSFVFPRNNVGHREALAAYGIRCYRGTAPAGPQSPSLMGSVAKLARATVTTESPQLVVPQVDRYGLVNVPASLYLFGFEGLARTVVEASVGDPMVEQATLGIDEAAERDGVFHMWLHPNNITAQRDAHRLRDIFAHLDQRRAQTDLTVATMADVATALDADRAPESELA